MIGQLGQALESPAVLVKPEPTPLPRLSGRPEMDEASEGRHKVPDAAVAAGGAHGLMSDPAVQSVAPAWEPAIREDSLGQVLDAVVR